LKIHGHFPELLGIGIRGGNGSALGSLRGGSGADGPDFLP